MPRKPKEAGIPVEHIADLPDEQVQKALEQESSLTSYVREEAWRKRIDALRNEHLYLIASQILASKTKPPFETKPTDMHF